MKSVRLQLVLALVVTTIAAGWLVSRGLPPSKSILETVCSDEATQFDRALKWEAVNACGSGGWAAIHSAAQQRDSQTVRRLLAAGADVNAAENCRGTALQRALLKEDYDTARLLIEHGADVDLEGGDYASRPLTIAAECRDGRFAEMLLAQGVDVRGVSRYDGGTALHAASAAGNVETARRLIEAGADVNALDGSGERPLHCAAGYGQTDIVRLLLAQGAEIDAAQFDGSTALHRAAGSGRMDVVRVLVEAGANVRAKGLYGQLPSYFVEDNDEIGRYLREREAVAGPR